MLKHLLKNIVEGNSLVVLGGHVGALKLADEQVLIFIGLLLQLFNLYLASLGFLWEDYFDSNPFEPRLDRRDKSIPAALHLFEYLVLQLQVVLHVPCDSRSRNNHIE
jgi:hypothetical protein